MFFQTARLVGLVSFDGQGQMGPVFEARIGNLIKKLGQDE
jgi:hypothetical protein